MSADGAARRVVALARHMQAEGLDGAALYAWLTRDNRELREAIFEFLKDPLFRPNHYAGVREARALTSRRMAAFAARRFIRGMDYVDDPLRFQAALECLSFCDYSLAIKCGVHWTLCGGTIAKLGTARHHAEILPKMDTLELPGCFGMTELAFGSNVAGIQTTAEYDAAAQEFVLRTPTNEASKYWIGGAAETAKICAVFAQLTAGGAPRGVHVFVARLRDDAGRLAPGVRIRDCGAKQGLNGVDNGQIWFDGARVPRAALLDRFASVSPRGEYSSPIPSAAARFGVTVGGLTTGRLLIAQGAVDALKVGLTVAVRYSLARPQFGGRAVMGYVTQQRRLAPALATAYALHLALAELKAFAASAEGRAGGAAAAKRLHVGSSALKAAATWHRVAGLQACREACGGQGFLAANLIGPMLNDMNVDVTFEGDNTVLMQQVARPLVDEVAAGGGAARPPPPPAVDVQSLGAGAAAALLRWRVAALAAEVGGAVAGAAAGGGPAAGAAALDAALDRVVALGWAWADATTADTFFREAAAAPRTLAPALADLALLYALSRVEAAAADYADGGALPRGGGAALRARVNALCAAACGGGTARALVDGFGVPPHLCDAPALDWRRIGAE